MELIFPLALYVTILLLFYSYYLETSPPDTLYDELLQLSKPFTSF